MEERTPRLLVIEDARDQAILVGVAARNALPGLEVHIAENGQEGIDFLSEMLATGEASTPDLVILDLFMPLVDGFGVLEWIGEHLNPVPFPVVVLTASANPDDVSRARSLGASDVFEKPTSLDKLNVTVRDLVTRFIRPGDILSAHLRHEA